MSIRYPVLIARVCLVSAVVFSSASVLADNSKKTNIAIGGSDAGTGAIEGKAYESIDAQGNVDFSDVRPDNTPSQVIGIPETNTMDSSGETAGTTPPPSATPSDSAATSGTDTSATDDQDDSTGGGGGYNTVGIVNPAVNGPLGYGLADPIRFQIATNPPLLDGHRIQWLVDNRVVGAPVPTPYFDATQLPEGDHRVTARIVDRAGNVVSTTDMPFNIARDNRAANRLLFTATGGNARGARDTEGASANVGVGSPNDAANANGARAREGARGAR